MSWHKPHKPPEWVFNCIARNWIIKPEEGVVLNSHDNHSIGWEHPDGYVILTLNGYRGIKRSHVIWFGHYGIWPEHQVDHDDRVKNNDKVNNLKYITGSGNVRNADRTIARTFPPGVYYNKKNKGYDVKRWVNSEPVYLKWFNRNQLPEALRLIEVADHLIDSGVNPTKEQILEKFYDG